MASRKRGGETFRESANKKTALRFRRINRAAFSSCRREELDASVESVERVCARADGDFCVRDIFANKEGLPTVMVFSSTSGTLRLSVLAVFLVMLLDEPSTASVFGEFLSRNNCRGEPFPNPLGRE